MTRKKVKLAYITNDSARKATFKKRKKGLLKKVNELSTLCDIEACAIIYSPYHAHAEVYPSAPGVQRVLGRFRKMPEMDQSKKMVNQESFLRQRIAKAADQLKKMRKDNREKEMTRVMFRGLTAASAARALQGMSVVDLNDLGWVIEQNIKDLGKRIERVVGKRPALKEEPVEMAVMLPPGWKKKEEEVEVEEKKVIGVSNAMKMGRGLSPVTGKQQWFMELMMSHQGHHEEQIMNFAFGGGSSSLWGNTNRVFP